MNIFTRIGSWIEHHFPEKMTVEEVNIRIDTISKFNLGFMDGVEHRFKLLFDDHEKLKEEVNTLKTNSIVRTKVVSSAPNNMTPFATRMPVGGNKSLQ